MKNYYQLNLPQERTKNTELLEKWVPTPPVDFGFMEPELVLSAQLLDRFKSIGASVRTVVLFGQRPGSVPVKEQRLIHSDVVNDTGSQWEKITCGINWEFYAYTVTKFHWWDTGSLTEVWPDGLSDYYNKLNSIQYGHRLKRGTDGARLLDTAEITHATPTLVRTDIPHSTEWNTVTEPRLNISVRFSETWHSWEEAVRFFRPLIKLDVNNDTDL
jgi:hypothetical protein